MSAGLVAESISGSSAGEVEIHGRVPQERVGYVIHDFYDLGAKRVDFELDGATHCRIVAVFATERHLAAGRRA